MSSSSSWSNTKRGFGRTAAPIYTFLHALSAISRSVSSSNALLSSSMVQICSDDGEGDGGQMMMG